MDPHGRPRARMTAAERGELIQTQAAALFARKGYASTSVEDIVSAAGVTKPMLYRHFASKRALAIHLLERYRSELIASAVDELDAGTSREDRIARMIDAWLTWTAAHPDAVRLLFTPIRGDAEVERTQADLHDRGRRTQAALIREFAPDLPDTLVEAEAEITFAGLTAVALWLGDDEARGAAARESLLRLVLHAVRDRVR